MESQKQAECVSWALRKLESHPSLQGAINKVRNLYKRDGPAIYEKYFGLWRSCGGSLKKCASCQNEAIKGYRNKLHSDKHQASTGCIEACTCYNPASTGCMIFVYIFQYCVPKHCFDLKKNLQSIYLLSWQMSSIQRKKLDWIIQYSQKIGKNQLQSFEFKCRGLKFEFSRLNSNEGIWNLNSVHWIQMYKLGILHSVYWIQM